MRELLDAFEAVGTSAPVALDVALKHDLLDALDPWVAKVAKTRRARRSTGQACSRDWLSDFLYVPANTPHLPWNPSETEPCVGVVARTDPNEQESIELLPWLE